MTMFRDDTHRSFSAFCNEIGSNRLLVQGGGGNVSWKDGNLLWIKASGTSIADAMTSDIFVPVDLKELKKANSKNLFDQSPTVLDDSLRRPSIETAFHGILPQKFVVHLHEVNSLSRLVMENAESWFTQKLPKDFSWALFPYYKPGGELARAIHASNHDLATLDFILLQNHGIIVVDDELSSLSEKLKRFLDIVDLSVDMTEASVSNPEFKLHEAVQRAFVWVSEPQINKLATNPDFLRRVKENWVMYPDHAVFLGPHPCIAEHDDLMSGPIENLVEHDFIFASGHGVLKKKNVSIGALAQLLCFADIVGRLEVDSIIRNLSRTEVDALLQWDAEKYRQRQAGL